MGNEKDTTTTVQTTESSPRLSITRRPPVHRERPAWLRAILLVVDVGLALSPLLFLGIAFAAIAYNHKRVSDDPVLKKTVVIPVKDYTYNFSYTAGGKAVIDTAQIAVSIFPILFAAIVGRFMKSWALHRAERGSTMGILEQLYGSQNLSNSVQLLFALRGPGLLGIAVVVVWLLSPVGGQGVKRVLGTTTTDVNGTATVYYCNTSSSLSQFNSEKIYAQARLAMGDALSALLFTDSFSGASDIWGNVKIPYLSEGQTNSSEWMDIDTDGPYSAMTGLLINNLPNDTSTSFNILTSYVDMACRDAETFDYLPLDFSASGSSDMTGYQNFLDWAGPLMYYWNMTNATDTSNVGSALAYNGWQEIIDMKVYRESTYGSITWPQPPSFVFATQEAGIVSFGNDTGNRIYAFECASSIQWLEAKLECDDGTASECSVLQTRAAKRPSSLYEDPIFANSTVYDPGSSAMSTILDLFSQQDSLTRAGLKYNEYKTVLNKYLAGQGTYAAQTSKQVEWANVTGSVLSPQLGNLFNTAWLIGVEYLALVKPKVMNATYLQAFDPTSPQYKNYSYETSPDYFDYDVTAASATTTITYKTYQVSWTWVIIAIVISLLLLFLGLLGLYFRHNNQHPDVLGFVSTLTRDNPHFEPPPQAEKLDGLEMANYYKHTKVQLVNTANMDEQARITLRQIQRH